MSNPEQNLNSRLHPRQTEAVSIQVPVDTLESLKKIADSREMTLEVLLSLYIGRGLRQDLSKLFSERVLETTAQVLVRHLQSEEEISKILQEIQAETTR